MVTNRNRRLVAGAIGSMRRLFSTEPKMAAPPPRRQGERLYRRLSALGRGKGTVENTINEYLKEGNSVEKFELISCVRELRRYKRYEHALQIIEWMEAQNYTLGFRDHALHMELITKVKGIDATENFFNSLPPSAKNKCTYGALLFCYCDAKIADKALDIFARLEEMNMMSTLPYSNLMSLYLQTEQPEKVPPLMEEMKKRHMQPHLHAYNLLMQSYACLNDVNGVERVFEEMRQDKKVQCDWTTYSNLAIVYIRAGHVGKAELALKMVEKNMNSNNREAFHFLISLYASISDLQKVHRVWKSLKTSFKDTTNMSYLIMLQALRKLNDLNGMKKCYEEWESAYTCFDIRLANAVINAYLTHEKPDEAETILRNALERSQGAFFRACEMFMTFYLKKHKIWEALQHMEVAVSKVGVEEWQPPKDILDSFLKYFKEENDDSSAEQFCKLMRKINCVDICVYESLFQTLPKRQADN